MVRTISLTGYFPPLPVIPEEASVPMTGPAHASPPPASGPPPPAPQQVTASANAGNTHCGGLRSGCSLWASISQWSVNVTHWITDCF